MFNYDLLGYGMMALSTFFIGLSVQADSKADKWMKALMMIHGIFFFNPAYIRWSVSIIREVFLFCNTKYF